MLLQFKEDSYPVGRLTGRDSGAGVLDSGTEVLGVIISVSTP